MLRFNNFIHWAGLASCALLIIACFLPWVHFNSIDTTFTGFKVIEFPNGTYYGKAGNIILPITAFILIFMLVSKVWAKRVNLFLASFLLAFSIRSYIVFTSSLFDGEVDKKIGIYLVIILPVIILVSSIFPKGGSVIPEDVRDIRH